MSRRPATIVQADIARAGRAAKQLGPEWIVEIEGGVIRLVRAPLSRTDGPEDPS
jgi:class 3 adenylate cyclase